MSTSRQLDAFLCYAKEDHAFVHDLCKRLENDGIATWLADENLIPGQDWKLEIFKAVKRSDVALILLSNKSIKKEGYVQKEIRITLEAADEKPEGEIFVIPVRLENCEPPISLACYQWVDIFEVGGYIKLIQALIARANSLGIMPPKCPKSDENPFVDSTDLDPYLKPNSPFIVPFNEDISNSIINDLRNDPSYYPGEAIAKYLAIEGVKHSRENLKTAIGEIDKLLIKFQYPFDANSYGSGFYRSFRLLTTSYLSLTIGREQTTNMILKNMKSNMASDEYFVISNLSDGEKWLSQNLRTGEYVIIGIILRELKVSNDLMYKIGLRASFVCFKEYLDMVADHFGYSIWEHGYIEKDQIW